MTSLVQYQQFKLQSHIFSDSQVFEELLGGMELPTPPLSPDHADSPGGIVADSTKLTKTPTDLDVGETILQQIMVSEDLYLDSQGTYSSDSSDVLDIDSGLLLGTNTQALLQDDCMWTCTYEPKHSSNCNGIYTPGPSPPPEEKNCVEDDDEDENENTNISKSSHPSTLSEEEPAECISPNEVLVYAGVNPPTETKEDVEKSSGLRSLSSSSSRFHPQAATTSEESEEEIDVVTITDRPARAMRKMAIRKRTLAVSAPCSRQTSPVCFPPTKKRRCHSKRTQRLSSAGSNYGDGLESDDEQRRASHNVLERKRRNDLKYSFQILRGQIPELEDNQRAPKVTILRKAAEYIKQIRDKEEELQTRMAKERRKESKLLQRLAYLKTLQ